MGGTWSDMTVLCCAVQTMAQQQLSEAYKRDLLGQIQAHREATQAERQAYLEEGKRIKQQQLREKATLEMVSTRNSFCCAQTQPKISCNTPRNIPNHIRGDVDSAHGNMC